jgi:hypothetical protein
MGKRKQTKRPPLQHVVYPRGTRAFTPEHVSRIVAETRLSAVKPAKWIAEALNDTATGYFTAFALAQAGTPSEQLRWARELRLATDHCLGMLAAEAQAERPREADHRVHSALFHCGEPTDIESVPGPASELGYYPAIDALNSIPGKLWDLRRMAEHAEERWRSAQLGPKERRKRDPAIFYWISRLADIYERSFDEKFPNLPQPACPFARFADAARSVAMETGGTTQGTDGAARARLAKLTRSRMSSFVREHRQELGKRLSESRAIDYQPNRITLGMEPSASELDSE